MHAGTSSLPSMIIARRLWEAAATVWLPHGDPLQRLWRIDLLYFVLYVDLHFAWRIVLMRTVESLQTWHSCNILHLAYLLVQIILKELFLHLLAATWMFWWPVLWMPERARLLIHVLLDVMQSRQRANAVHFVYIYWSFSLILILNGKGAVGVNTILFADGVSKSFTNRVIVFAKSF